MGIRKKFSAIVEHIYCAMCGQAISAPISLTDTEKRELENSGKSIKMQVMCPGCGHETDIDIIKENIHIKEEDI